MKTSIVVNMLCLKGFFIHGFPKLRRFQDHHNHVLKRFLPKVKKHLVILAFSLLCILVTFMIFKPAVMSVNSCIARGHVTNTFLKVSLFMWHGSIDHTVQLTSLFEQKIDDDYLMDANHRNCSVLYYFHSFAQ